MYKRQSQLDQAVKKWLQLKIADPTFDNPKSAMPQLSLPEQEISSLSEFLFDLSNYEAPQAEYGYRWMWLLRVNRMLQSTVVLVLVGIVLGFILGFGVRRLFFRNSHRRS